MIALQYNPETLSRTLQVKAVGTRVATVRRRCASRGRRSRPSSWTPRSTRSTSSTPATRWRPSRHRAAARRARDRCLPRHARLQRSDAWPTRARSRSPRSWRRSPVRLEPKRMVPVRITDFSITEEAFDPALNPIRAKVSLGLRVLSIDDLGFAHAAAASTWPTSSRRNGWRAWPRPARSTRSASAARIRATTSWG